MSPMHKKRTSLFGRRPLRLGPVSRAPGRLTTTFAPSLIMLKIRTSPAAIMLAIASLRKSLVVRPCRFSAGGASAGGTG
jgi:hypothetical protein